MWLVEIENGMEVVDGGGQLLVQLVYILGQFRATIREN